MAASSSSIVVPTTDENENDVTVLAHSSSHSHSQTKPKPISISKGGWKSAIFIIFVEVAERFANYGVSGNLITYLTNVAGQPISTAAKNVNVWLGVSALFPLFGAFLADSYLGRYKTILLSSITFLLGLLLLVLSVELTQLKHCQPVFFLALYILAVGEGGHKPCVQTFAADQFDEDLPEHKAEKSSFFNWWYIGTVFGSTAAILMVIPVQENVGWAMGFGLPAMAVGAALVAFLIGTPRFRREVFVGSPFTRVAQVMVAAARKRQLPNGLSRGVFHEDASKTASASRYLARTNQYRFLDKATIIEEIDESIEERNHWRLCSVNQVEEVKLLLRLIPIWLTCLMYMVDIAQLNTYFIKQGSTMNRSIFSPPSSSQKRSFEVPPATLQVITGLTILAAVPIYDRTLVPLARTITGHPRGITILQRMGIGNFMSILTMIISALVEAKRVSIAQQNGLLDMPKSVIPMSIWWLVPQYALVGVSNMFMIVGLQELFYDQMHEEMRSMSAALYLSIMGVGSFVSGGVISIVEGVSERCGDKWLGDNLNRAHLDGFYWVLAGLSVLSLGFYVWVAKGFVYKKFDGDGLTQNQGIELVLENNLEGRV